jgi:hypothetical protein
MGKVAVIVACLGGLAAVMGWIWYSIAKSSKDEEIDTRNVPLIDSSAGSGEANKVSVFLRKEPSHLKEAKPSGGIPTKEPPALPLKADKPPNASSSDQKGGTSIKKAAGRRVEKKGTLSSDEDSESMFDLPRSADEVSRRGQASRGKPPHQEASSKKPTGCLHLDRRRERRVAELANRIVRREAQSQRGVTIKTIFRQARRIPLAVMALYLSRKNLGLDQIDRREAQSQRGVKITAMFRQARRIHLAVTALYLSRKDLGLDQIDRCLHHGSRLREISAKPHRDPA